MSSKQPDFDIKNYNLEELLTIFGIGSPVQKEAIMGIAADFIKKYKELGQAKYVEFFSQGMNKLLSNFEQVEGILGKVDNILDEVEETRETVLTQAQETAEDLTNRFEQVRTQAKDFINPPIEAAAPNILHNRYYNAQRTQTRMGEGVVMPNRSDYINVPTVGVGAHAPQLQNRLFLPNAFAEIPFAQGYRNPTLQNAFLTWVNVDSQYREILPTGISSASCPGSIFDPSNNIHQADSSTDFTFALASPITNVLSMTVGSIEVPMAGYYTFSDKYGNTTFELHVANNSPICLKIPEGNYDAAGLQAIMNKVLLGGYAAATGTSATPGAGEARPQLIVNASNQKIYLFWGTKIEGVTGPAPPANTPPDISIKWFERKSCGNCKNCIPSCTKEVYDTEMMLGPTGPTGPTAREVKRENKEHACSDKNTGKKINSTLGWTLGFREAESKFQPTFVPTNPVADASFNLVGVTGNTYYGTFGTCVWNELGTKYLILEVDDFNRNRNSGNMGTMSMPACTESFKLPTYAKKVSQIYPICDPSANIQRFPDPGDITDKDPPERIKFTADQLNEVLDVGPVAEFGPTGSTGTWEQAQKNPYRAGCGGTKKSYYEKFNRACRKGTPANPIAIRGEDTLTKAQKYTAREIRGTQQNSCVNQYYAPQSSNILFRFPIQRISTNPQVPIVTPGPGAASGRRYFGPITIEKLRVRILDDKGYVIDLNCGEISFSLVLERLYQY